MMAASGANTAAVKMADHHFEAVTLNAVPASTLIHGAASEWVNGSRHREGTAQAKKSGLTLFVSNLLADCRSLMCCALHWAHRILTPTINARTLVGGIIKDVGT